MDATAEPAAGQAWARGSGCWVIPVQGQSVAQLRFDRAVGVTFDGGLEVRVEQCFTLRPAGGVEQLVDPEGDSRLLAPVLGLGRAAAVAGLAFDDGRLELTFTAGSRLLVGPGSKFEAWQLNGPRGLLVVSSPGGGLITWGLSAES